MLHALNALVAPALMERATLVLNHLVGAEPQAVARLVPHAGRVLSVQMAGWPTLLPALPQLSFRVTPAGLFEWAGDQPLAVPADLQMSVDASNPALLAAKAVAGEQPRVDIVGDAGLAADVSWLLDNVRWDAEADLERLFGPKLAHEIARLAGWFGDGLRTVLRQGGEWAARFKPGGTERAGP